MSPDAAIVALAEKHGAIACFNAQAGEVTLTLTPQELRKLINSAINTLKEEKHVSKTSFVHRCPIF